MSFSFVGASQISSKNVTGGRIGCNISSVGFNCCQIWPIRARCIQFLSGKELEVKTSDWTKNFDVKH